MNASQAFMLARALPHTSVVTRSLGPRLHYVCDRRRFCQVASVMSGRSDSELVADVIQHWFGSKDIGRFDTLEEKNTLWYGGSKEIDDEIRSRFGADVEKALDGGWDHLIDGREHPDTGELALVIMLDQYTRNIYRGTAKAFAGDEKSRRVSYHMFEKDRWDEAKKRLPVIMRLSFLMPLMHGESMQNQNDCIEQAEVLIRECEEAGSEGAACAERMRYTRAFAEKHRNIIEQFGRFPYRNKALRRETTAEEEKFLVDGDRFGQ